MDRLRIQVVEKTCYTVNKYIKGADNHDHH